MAILLDPAWRARAAAECRRFVVARFDLDGVVDRLRRFYFGAIDDGAADERRRARGVWPPPRAGEG